MKTNHQEVIRQEFSKQASRFEDKKMTAANREYLQWMVSHINLLPHFNVLDVAAGTGLLSRAIAPKVKQVVALDQTPEMLWQGQQAAEREGITNIIFEQGQAEKLPYPDKSFDVVVNRFAIHHFENPANQIKEMVRVCQANGQVAVIDIVAPKELTLAINYNRLERLRDPSHTKALSLGELENLVKEAELNVTHTAWLNVEVDTHQWLNLTDPAPEVRDQICEEMMQELKGGTPTGKQPFLRENQLMFTQTFLIVIGVK